jgi:hypothetical protein
MGAVCPPVLAALGGKEWSQDSPGKIYEAKTNRICSHLTEDEAEAQIHAYTGQYIYSFIHLIYSKCILGSKLL